jgi:hypothetical protein
MEFDGANSVSFKDVTFRHPLLGSFTLFVMDSGDKFIQDDTTRRAGVC